MSKEQTNTTTSPVSSEKDVMGSLTQMQSFFLDVINYADGAVDPCYLANLLRIAEVHNLKNKKLT